MRKQLAALLWKEWRDGWPVMAGLCAVAAGVGAAAQWRLAVVREPDYAIVLLGVYSALVGARLFAPEAESGSLGFLLRQPVTPGTLWRAKLWTGAAFLAALYALWLWAASCAGRWPVGALLERAESSQGYVVSMVLLVPLGAFAAALFLSAAVDNTGLAFVGGCVAGMVHVAWLSLVRVVVARFTSGWLCRVGLGADLYFEPLTFLGALVPIAVFLALSRAVFQIRARR